MIQVSALLENLFFLYKKICAVLYCFCSILASGQPSVESHEEEVDNPAPVSVNETSEASGSTSTNKSSQRTPQASKKMKTLDGFVRTLTPRQHQEIDEAIGRAVYAGGLPLSLFDNNKFWETALKKLNPVYSPPTAYKLGQPLLKAEVSKVMKAAEEKMQNALCVSLLSDGWKNIVCDKVINVIVCTPDPIFFDAIYPPV
jgi:hypothetical protein